MSSADQAKLAAERAARVAERKELAEGKMEAKNHGPQTNEPRPSKRIGKGEHGAPPAPR